MTTKSTSAIERISRVLAGERLSANAEGTDHSAGPEVDASWHRHRAEAVAILKSLREPPPEVAHVGLAEAWPDAITAMLEGSDQAEDPSAFDTFAENAEHFLRAPS